MLLLKKKQLTDFANMTFARLAGAADSTRPVFYDVEAVCPELADFGRNFNTIRAELDDVLQRSGQLPQYFELDHAQTYISGTVDKERQWNVFLLYVKGARPQENRRQCPRTVALLDRVPNLLTAFFSILEPRKSIPAHCASYRGYLRYHLGLRVPKTNPPSMRVRDQHYTWREGEQIIFDDTWEHEVTNYSDETRVVLLADIRRPMPGLANLVNICYTETVGRHYGARVMRNLNALER